MPRELTTLDNIYENNIGTLEVLTNAILPVKYPHEFFEEFFSKGKSGKKDTFFGQLAYYSEVPVGAVKAKLIPNKKGGVLQQGVYIEVLVVLEHYRSKGIGRTLLNYIEKESKRHFQHDIYVHVACDNEFGIEWYKSHGFAQEGDIIKDYYKDTTGSPDCLVLRKYIA
ncbi:hypothetical protein HG535_0A06310 [Zygotorulaspora mrakii]|uniref:N-acetyltransferase domain-containing protein n=1 Tax=Zygotorulaspora mrakii TaxID=42260 RepID=A0A7H9AY46_ZYGMR|nr:uncharacterized protein HG535_0A06310 [Zygotorulaspora mrakii]QLG70689.1 hypothetical protein HG535_0A06310 [Zygotorulaspora mrakii]